MAGLKTVARVARLAAHQEEILEFQLRRTAETLRREKGGLSGLAGELDRMVDRFTEETASQPRQSRRALDLWFEHAQLMIRSLEKKERQIERLKREWDKQRTLWEESHRRRKALEMLEAKLERRKKLEELRREQQHLDELNLNRRKRA